MTKLQALVSGVVGASSLTLVHELARQFIPHAPRVDVLGMRAIAKSLRSIDQPSPSQDQLYWLAMIGDLFANSLYYSLVGIGDPQYIWRRGLALGAAAGLGAAILPRPIGLGRQPNQQLPSTQIMTFTWYLVGGLVAAATTRAFTTSVHE